MNRISTLLLLTILSQIFILSCTEEEYHGPHPDVYIIPKPVELKFRAGTLNLSGALISATDALQFETDYLIKFLQEKTAIPVSKTADGNRDAQISLELDPGIQEDEGYRIEITSEHLEMKAKTSAGIFFGIQTLKQLLPPSQGSSPRTLTLPCLRIKDYPRFPYRGMHLDVCRHFFGVDIIKRYLDVMSWYKLNHFHWHLTDDQGWRLPSDAFPKLNTISSWRNGTLIGHADDRPMKFDTIRYGGFYTKDQIRDVVAYAAARHITIVPEVEMPGHSQAVLAAYPEFGCTGEPVEVMKQWGISEDVLCPKEETFAFLDTILSEVMDLFPGPYIHVGGDECPKTQWEQSEFCQKLMKREGLSNEMELQSWFIHRIEKFINSRGRTLVGWDEILEGGIAPNAVVMSWRGTEGGVEAAKQGHDVIMTPTSNVYFDYYQSSAPGEPLAIGGYLPLETVYKYDPLPPSLTRAQQKHILGAQGNVWTEYISAPLHLDYMAWPRGIALAEVVWTPAKEKNLDDFLQRLEQHLDLLRSKGIYAANHLYDLTYDTHVEDGNLYVDFFKLLPSVTIYCSTDGEQNWEPVARSLLVDKTEDLVARSQVGQSLRGKPLRLHVDKHLATGKSISMVRQPAPEYNDGGISHLINGIQGSDERYGDKEWRGFDGDDLDATIDLGEMKHISRIETRCFFSPGEWIYLPDNIEVRFSSDGRAFSPPMNMERYAGTGKVYSYRLAPIEKEARYLKIEAKNMGKIPEGMQGAGHPAWLFVDEIAVY